MAVWERKGFLIFGALALFALGVGVGGYVTQRFQAPGSPALPIPELLAETHQLLDEGKLAEAERNYQSVLSRDPGNPEAITHLGNIALRRGDAEGALRHYDEALRRDPSYIHALWDKGLLLRDKGDEVGAIGAWEAFERLVSADSQDAATVKKFIAESRARLAAKVGVAAPVKSP